MGRLQVNIETVLSAARSAGATPKVLEGLRQRLHVINADNGVGLMDEGATRALKVLDRQSGCIWEGRDQSEEERSASRKATLHALFAGTEAHLFIMTGHWERVAQFLEEQLTGKAGRVRGLSEANIRVNDQIMQVASLARSFGSQNAPHPINFVPFYNAHRVACVLTCPFSHCAENFNCWETRRSFCAIGKK